MLRHGGRLNDETDITPVAPGSFISSEPRRPNLFPTCLWMRALSIQSEVLKTSEGGDGTQT